MKVIIYQWKDPDWFDGSQEENLGLSEYLLIEYDTETKEATVVRKER